MKETVRKLINLFDACTRNTTLLWVNCGLLVVSVAVAIVLVVVMRKSHVFGTTIKEIKARSHARAKRRMAQEEQLQREEGNREKKNLFYRMDLCLYQAGIRRRMPALTAELFLAGTLLSGVLLAAIVTGIGNRMFAFIAVGMYWLLVYLIVQLKRKRNNHRIEKNIMQFVNLVAAYSRSSNDIVQIFGKMYPYLDEPLRSLVKECHSAAISSGDVSGAMQHMTAQTGHRHFESIISNLELASRHETDYEKVIETNKEILRDYLARKAERDSMYLDARVQMGILLVLGAVLCKLISGLFEQNVLTMLYYAGIGGQTVLCIVGGIVLYALKSMVIMGGGEDR